MQAPTKIDAALEAAVMARSGQVSGNEIKFLCPLHDDHHPSARYNITKKTWFCDVCKKGGGWVDLGKRLGVHTEDAREAQPAAQKKVVKVYDYCDAEGHMLFQTVRYEPKDFKQRHASVNGHWIWNLKDVTLVPYRLPELLAADPWAIVYHSEGEKDIDRMLSAGLVATTNPLGAGKWRDDYSIFLTGRDVVILPHNDDAGRAHAQAVAKSVKAAGASRVRVMNLPGLLPKGDISDWLDLGHPLEELAALVEKAPDWEEEQIPPVTFEPLGLGYRVAFPPSAVALKFAYLDRRSDGLHAEITVESTLSPGPRRLHWANLNLSSTSSRSGLAKHLGKRAEGTLIDWDTMMEDACYRVAQAQREGEPFISLSEVEVALEEQWLIENFCPLDQPTTIFGPGSAGKSRLALALGLSVATGTPIVPGYKPMMQAPILYLDFETGPKEIRKRCREICAGVNLRVPDVRYRRCGGRSLADQVEEVLTELQQQQAKLLIVDSVEMASCGDRDRGSDANAAVIRMHSALRLLNVSSILVDHIGKVGIADAKTPRNPYGSIYKTNLSRMCYEVRSSTITAGRIALALYNTKRNNDGVTFPPVGLTVDFEGGKYTSYLTGKVDRPTLVDGLTEEERIDLVLQDGIEHTLDAISEATRIPKNTLGPLLSRGKTEGRWINPSRGSWAQYPAHDGAF